MSIVLISSTRISDSRGWFMETYHAGRLANLGITTAFVQDNHSCSTEAGTVRGLHFQLPPHAQAKLVRCIRGAVMDVVVDIRRGSPSYGRHIAIELSGETAQQLYIPVGFAHGFVTLTDGAELSYKVSSHYNVAADAGIRWNDTQIGIEWPLPDRAAILSEKDRNLPFLADFESPFPYDGDPMELTEI